MVELAYTTDLKSVAFRLAGSSPAIRTNFKGDINKVGGVLLNRSLTCLGDINVCD